MPSEARSMTGVGGPLELARLLLLLMAHPRSQEREKRKILQGVQYI